MARLPPREEVSAEPTPTQRCRIAEFRVDLPTRWREAKPLGAARRNARRIIKAGREQHRDSAAFDAEGLGELTRALRRVSGQGGRVLLIAPPGPLKRLLAVTRLDTVFTVVDSVAEAAG